jgi:hypothetical protein
MKILDKIGLKKKHYSLSGSYYLMFIPNGVGRSSIEEEGGSAYNQASQKYLDA